MTSRIAVDVARGASYGFINIIGTWVISVAAFAFIARLIGREEMGGLAVLLLVVAGAQFIAALGISSTATRFVSSMQAVGDYLKMREAGYDCIFLNGLGTIVLSVLIYFSADALALLLYGSPLRGSLLKLLTLEIAATSIAYSLSSVLAGLKKFKELSLIGMASFAFRQALVVLLLEFGWGLPGIVIGWGIGDSVGTVFYAAFARKYLGPVSLGFNFTSLLKFSAPLFLGHAASFAWSWFDRALLVPLVSLAQLGSYNVAVTAFGMLDALPQSISGTLFPFYSHFYSGIISSQTDALANAVKTASRYVSFITVPLSIGLAVTAVPATTLLAGNSYADSAYPLAILSVSLAMACQVKALSQIFVVLGKSLTSAAVTIASVLIPLAIGVVAVTHLGIIGASIARGLSLVIALGLSMVILRRSMNIQFDGAAYRAAWVAGIPMGVAVLLAEVFFNNKYLLPLYALLGATVFLIALRLQHAVSEEDIHLLRRFLGHRFTFLVNLVDRTFR